MYNLRKRANEKVSTEASDWESTTRCFVENRENYLPERRTKVMIAGHYKQRRAAGIEVAALKVRLICPVSIYLPDNGCLYTLTAHQAKNRRARARVNCTHLQCFDLASYLRMQMTAEDPTWTCPICRVPTDTGRLKIDEFTSKVLASEQTQNAEDVTLLQDGTFEPVVPVHPSVVVTQDDLDFAVDENLLDFEDIKPVIDRGCSASKDSPADLQGSDSPERVADEPSAPAKRARLDTALATMERQEDQLDGRVNHAEILQVSPDDIEARTTSSTPGQHEQAEAVNDVRPDTTVNCAKQFTSKKRFEEHRSKHHLTNVTPGPCTQCSSRYENRTVYHCEGHHLLRPFSCAKCTRSFPTKKQLDQHGRDHDSSHRARCPSCGGVFREMLAVVNHMKGAHGQKVNYCSLCKDAFSVDREAHVSSAFHQETRTMLTNCDKLKLSCDKCSKRTSGAQFLLHYFDENTRKWSLAKCCGDCRRNLRKDGKTSRDYTLKDTDLSEIRRMLAEQESASEVLKQQQQRAAEAKRKPAQRARAEASSTRKTSNSSSGRATPQVPPAPLAHRTQTGHQPWLRTLCTAIGIPPSQGLGATPVRNNLAPTALSQVLPQPGQCPPRPPMRPPPTAGRHVIDEYYRRLGMFYDHRIRRHPHYFTANSPDFCDLNRFLIRIERN